MVYRPVPVLVYIIRGFFFHKRTNVSDRSQKREWKQQTTERSDVTSQYSQRGSLYSWSTARWIQASLSNHISLYGRAKLISGDGGSVTQLMLIAGL
jgi:hypothetical protein